MAFTAPLTLPLRTRPIPPLHPRRAPSTAHPTACTPLPNTPDHDTLRTAYKAAKAAYKSAKRTTIPPPAHQLALLEGAYRAAKAEYKAFKRSLENSPTVKDTLLPDVPMRRSFAARYPPTPIYDTPTPTSAPARMPITPTGNCNTASSQGVQVCAGKTCHRLGAATVAELMRLPPPSAKCMKRCGGVGPTIAVDGVPTKVNFRKAVADAMRTAVEQYQAL